MNDVERAKRVLEDAPSFRIICYRGHWRVYSEPVLWNFEKAEFGAVYYDYEEAQDEADALNGVKRERR